MENDTAVPHPDARITSLAAELARPDDDARRLNAQRWKAAVHRLCVLYTTAHARRYETEWQLVMEQQPLMDDLQRRSKLIALAAIDVLAIQNEQMLLVCRAESTPHDEDAMSEMSELTEAMHNRIVEDRPVTS